MDTDKIHGKMSTGESVQEAAAHSINRLHQIRGDGVNIEELTQGYATFEDAAEQAASDLDETIKGVAKAEGLSATKVRKEFIMDFLDTAYTDAQMPNPAATA